MLGARRHRLALSFLALILAGAARAAPAPIDKEWKDPALMRTFLKKAALADRLAVYRDWLGMASLEKPALSSELARVLAEDMVSLDAVAARELVPLIAQAMRRGSRFWDDGGDARERLVGAVFDRPELDLSALAVSLAPLAPAGFPFTRQRAAKLIVYCDRIAAGAGPAWSDAELKALWSIAVRGLSAGADSGSARRLAARIQELAGYSLWTWASRSPPIAPEALAAAFSDPKLPIAEAPLLFALAADAEIGDGGALGLQARYDKKSSLEGLLAARAKAGDSISRDFAALAALPADAGPAAAGTADPRAIGSLGDWAAGLALLRRARGPGSPPSEAELLPLLDPARPCQAAAAASLLAGTRSPEAIASLSNLLRDKAARDPALLVVAMRVLAGVAGADSVELLVAQASSPAAEVRETACRSLGSVPDPRAVPPLSAILLDRGESDGLREACAASLRRIGDEACLRTFAEFLSEPADGSRSDNLARIYAAISLGEKRYRGAARALLANLDPSRELDLNYHCIVALGRIADPSSLRSLLPIVQGGLPAWKAAGRSRAASAAYWALLPLEPSLAERFYLDRWNARTEVAVPRAARSAAAEAPDPAIWYSALYLSRNASQDTAAADRSAWEAYLEAALGSAIAADCVMAGEALDRFGSASLREKAASMLGGLEPYAKAWIAAALVHHPEASMIPAFGALLGENDDYLAYASLAAMEGLLRKLPVPLSPELRASIAGYRAKLSRLDPGRLDGSTREWLGVLRRNLDKALEAMP